MKNCQIRSFFQTYLVILIGSALYAAATILFIFPHRILLGGTSGISVILDSLLPLSPGNILVIINCLLILLAFVTLGRDMAVKTLVGSLLTTAFVGIFEQIFAFEQALISNVFLSAIVGAAVIAVAGGMMFYVDSSSGGTDIIALIVKKYARLNIGKALLVTDVLIVVVGGLLSGWTLFLCSFLGLLIKTLGIDLVIASIRKMQKRGTP